MFVTEKHLFAAFKLLHPLSPFSHRVVLIIFQLGAIQSVMISVIFVMNVPSNTTFSLPPSNRGHFYLTKPQLFTMKAVSLTQENNEVSKDRPKSEGRETPN